MNTLNRLPVLVQLVVGETPESYWDRLCAANLIAPADLWLAMRHVDRGLQIAVTPRSAVDLLEKIGGLRPGQLRIHSGHPGCRHTSATQRVECPRCRMLPEPVTLCRRCSGGERVTAVRRTGPLCVRHARWHDSGEDIDMRGALTHMRAQRLLDGSLHRRGISYHSTEILAAAELLRLHLAIGGQLTDEPLRTELYWFPRRIELAALLTGERMVLALTESTVSRRAQAWLIDHIVGTFCENPPAARRALESLSVRGRELWIGDPPGVLPPRLVLSPTARQLLPKIPTLRARLLRHRSRLASAE